MGAHEGQACCLQLNLNDRLRFIDFPLDLQVDIRDMVPKLWPKGIQRERTLDSNNVRCYELKVHGNPWAATSSNWKTAAVAEASHFLLGIVRFMHDQGWRVAHSVNIMGKTDHDALFFERQNLKQIPANPNTKRAEMCCLEFGRFDKMRLTDGAPEVIEAVERTVRQHWQKGLSKQSLVEDAATYKFKLGGRPFDKVLKDRFVVDSLAMHLMRALKSAGWSVYATVALRGHGENPRVVNRWILKKDV